MAKMIKCKTCSNEIASNAKSCPSCGAKNKKPIYKRGWFIVVAFFVIVGIINGLGSDNSKAVASTEEKVPTEYKSALKSAETYSDSMNMSKAAIYDQLVSEHGGKFTEESAQYAIDNLDADWKNNALKSAKTYQESMSMSPKAIYDQLVSEHGGKFTEEEAQHAIDNLE